jgi:hypothetical protein
MRPVTEYEWVSGAQFRRQKTSGFAAFRKNDSVLEIGRRLGRNTYLYRFTFPATRRAVAVSTSLPLGLQESRRLAR